MLSKNFCILFRKIMVQSLTFTLRKCSSRVVLKPDISSVDKEALKVSTLYVPGRKGGEVYQIVKPFIDPAYLKDNSGRLKLSSDQRGIELDLVHTIRLTEEWVVLKNEHSVLVKKLEEYNEEISQLDPSETEKLNALEEEKKSLLSTIFASKNKVYDIEDIMMPLLNKIPHILHPSTPLQLNVMETCEESLSKKMTSESHVQIAKDMIIFPTKTPVLYFLNGMLPHLEYAIQSYFANRMLTEGFCPLSCVDFCKSFVLEAVGFDPYSPVDCISILEKKSSSIGQKLHLVGGASLESLCAYLTNMNVSRTNLPLKYFAVGRRYNAVNCHSPVLDLFSVVQSVNVHNLVVSDKPVEEEFDNMVKIMLSCYSKLELPFRTVKVSAKNLNITESRRTELELWSPAIKDYIPVAYVSQHDDFISKRLHITFGEDHKQEGFCNIVEGAMCNSPVIIGCVIENLREKENEFNVPEALKTYMLEK